METPGPGVGPGTSRPDVTITAARATAGVIAVGAIAFGLWRVRTIIILLLLALTFAAAIRPGVEWLRRHRVPEPLAILCFFMLGIGAFVLFFWAAVPPAVHELRHALSQPAVGASSVQHSTGIRHDVLIWIDKHLHDLPSGTAIFHPIAAYGHKATDAIVAVLFTLAATWFWVSERDSMIKLLIRLAPEPRRESAQRTYLEIDRRLGSYTRLKFLMVFAIGVVLAAGFYLVGLNYWLLVGGSVSLFLIIPVVGPLFGVLLILAVGLPQSVHTAVLAIVVLVVVREFQSYVINPLRDGQVRRPLAARHPRHRLRRRPPLRRLGCDPRDPGRLRRGDADRCPRIRARATASTVAAAETPVTAQLVELSRQRSSSGCSRSGSIWSARAPTSAATLRASRACCTCSCATRSRSSACRVRVSAS